jgi:hypothetical protein
VADPGVKNGISEVLSLLKPALGILKSCKGSVLEPAAAALEQGKGSVLEPAAAALGKGKGSVLEPAAAALLGGGKGSVLEPAAAAAAALLGGGKGSVLEPAPPLDCGALLDPTLDCIPAASKHPFISVSFMFSNIQSIIAGTDFPAKNSSFAWLIFTK